MVQEVSLSTKMESRLYYVRSGPGFLYQVQTFHYKFKEWVGGIKDDDFKKSIEIKAIMTNEEKKR